MATVKGIEADGSNLHIWLSSEITNELKIDQSISHSGICLTVVELKDDAYRVTAIAETISKTNLGAWKWEDKVNIERSLKIGDRLDGHFVQGHVDATVRCAAVTPMDGSWLYKFEYDEQYAELIIEKGSICLNGVSLTVFDIDRNSFHVAIIPYTYEHTNFSAIAPGTIVNVEFDVLGKYLLRHRTVG